MSIRADRPILAGMDVSPPRLGSVLLTSPASALAAVLLVISTGFLVDPRVSDWVSHLRNPALDALVAVINPIGSGLTPLAMCAALALVCRALGHARGCQAGWTGAVAFAVAGLIEFGLKYVVGRPRPVAAEALLRLELDSFPSGHATSVFAVATVLGSFYPALRWPLYALAGAITLGRVYLARHYTSDVFAGALIGLVIASVILRHRGAAVVSAASS